MTKAERHYHWEILDALAPIILKNVEGCVVEIGLGKSTEVLLPHSQNYHRRYLGCDNSRRRGRWAKELPIELYRVNSAKFREEFPEGLQVALAFLDGSHEHETVRADFSFFLARLTKGGVIFIHDTFPPEDLKSDDGVYCGNVYKLREEIEHIGLFQIFTWPYTALGCGLSMVMPKLGLINDNRWVARRLKHDDMVRNTEEMSG